jgi:hypothetical protein
MYDLMVKHEVERTPTFTVRPLFIAQFLCSAPSHRIAVVHRIPALMLLSCLPLAAVCADPAEMDRCRTITDATERLACFDRGAAVPPPPPAPRAEDFGKPPPRVPEATQVNAVSARLREFARTARGRAVFVLDNGQTWRQIDGDTSNVLEPAAGETPGVTIERGFLDSYNLMIEGRAGMVKVRRLQ